jgi:hypothetical protein
MALRFVENLEIINFRPLDENRKNCHYLEKLLIIFVLQKLFLYYKLQKLVNDRSKKETGNSEVKLFFFAFYLLWVTMRRGIVEGFNQLL